MLRKHRSLDLKIIVLQLQSIIFPVRVRALGSPDFFLHSKSNFYSNAGLRTGAVGSGTLDDERLYIFG